MTITPGIGITKPKIRFTKLQLLINHPLTNQHVVLL